VNTTAYYAIGIPVYIVLFGVESVIARARHHATPSLAGSLSNICTGLGAIVVGMVVGPVMVMLYSWAYHHFAVIAWADWWTPLIVALVLGDLANYWRHRFEHRWAVLWAVHHVHHSPTEMNLSVGMRHAWLSDTYAFPFYAVLPVLGIPPAQFFLAMVGVTLYALFTHSCEYSYPSFGILVTPRTHIVHHATNARYVDKNFAAMLVIWDRLFGTYQPLDPREPPMFGTTRGSETHDGALAQWVLFRELGRALRATRGLGAKLRLLVARPRAGDPVTPPAATPSRGIRIYVIAQLALLVAFAAHVYGLPGEAWRSAVAGALLIVTTIVAIGGLLDGRRFARGFEAIRMMVFVPTAAIIIANTWGQGGT